MNLNDQKAIISDPVDARPLRTKDKCVPAMVMITLLGLAHGNAIAQMADRILPAASPDKVVGDFFSAVAKADGKRIAALIAVTNADEKLLHPALAELCAAVGQFDRVTHETFGASKAGRWAAAAGDTLPRKTKTDAAHAGRSTVVLGSEGPDPMEVPLVQDAGSWRLTFGAVAALMRLRQVDVTIPSDEPLRRLTEMAEALKAVTADVQAHRIPSAEAAAEAGRAALADAARGKNAQ